MYLFLCSLLLTSINPKLIINKINVEIYINKERNSYKNPYKNPTIHFECMYAYI